MLSMSTRALTYNELMFLVDSELKSSAKLRSATMHMRELNINPIPLPDTMTYNADIIPGIHTMFGIEGAALNE